VIEYPPFIKLPFEAMGRADEDWVSWLPFQKMTGLVKLPIWTVIPLGYVTVKYPCSNWGTPAGYEPVSASTRSGLLPLLFKTAPNCKSALISDMLVVFI
jgi:hypothetical protein